MSDTKSAASVPTFAGVMLLVLGAFNLIDGFVMLEKSEYVAAQFLASNADTWGWVMLIFGVLQLVAGFMLLQGSGGRGLAVTVASIGMIVWFMLLFVFPFAAIIGTAVNFAVIASVLSHEPA